MESLDVLLADHSHYHTTLQCRSFITAKAGVTPFGQYRQALRELNSRTWSAFDEMLRMEELRVDIEEETETIENLERVIEHHGANERSIRRAQIRRARAEVELVQLERSLGDRLREWAEFYAQAVTLRGQLGLLPGETLDREKREELEASMFAHQFARTMRARFVCGERPLDPNLVQTIETLPQTYSAPLLAGAECQTREQFDAFCAQFPSPALPEPTAVPSIAEARDMVRERFEALPLAYSKLPEIVSAE